MAADRFSVAVVGAAGYVGGELLRLLAGHPSVGELRAFSASAPGRRWGDVHPALAHLGERHFEAGGAREAASSADAVILAMAHGRSQTVIGDVLAASPRLVVDMAADFRIHDPALYEEVYGPHAAPERIAGFVYGLADVVAAGLAGARLVAAPGCFATAALLALYPFARAGLLAEPPVVYAITGSTGAGVDPRRSTHHPVRAHNFFAYAPAGHRHEAEIVEQLRLWSGGAAAGVRLLPHSAPLVRGIHATALLRPSTALADPAALLAETYAGRPFVVVTKTPPELAAVVGTNFVHLHAAAREGGGEVVVYAAIDNLVKGAAGQAVQAMNLALGLDETAGLGFPGLYPC